MLNPEIAGKIEKALQELCPAEVGTITAERRIDELGLDSVSIGELVIELEDELDITLENEDIVGMETFGDLAALIQQRLEK